MEQWTDTVYVDMETINLFSCCPAARANIGRPSFASCISVYVQKADLFIHSFVQFTPCPPCHVYDS